VVLPVSAKTLRDHRNGILGWVTALILLAIMDLAVYPTVHSAAAQMTQFLKAYPQALKAMFGLGNDFGSGPGYFDAEFMSFLGPLVVLAIGIGFGAGATAAEEERGTIDWLLSTPLSRTRVMLEKSLGVLLAVLAAGLALLIVLLIGSPAGGLGLGAGAIGAATAALVLLGWAYAAVAVAAGAATGHRWAATGVAVALGLGGYLLTSLARIVPALESWRWLSPFTWYASRDALDGRLHAGYLAALLVTTLAGLAVAVVSFRRRDLGT
jgi:beta-exotoxin I transport system permease protein